MVNGRRPMFRGRPSIFFKPRSKRLARIISTKSPASFRRSIRTLKKGGLTLMEKRALVLARTRATAQLGRRNLSSKERRQFRTISRMRIGPITRRR